MVVINYFCMIIFFVCNMMYLFNQLFYLQSFSYDINLYSISLLKKILFNTVSYLYIFVILLCVVLCSNDVLFCLQNICICELLSTILYLIFDFRINKLNFTKRIFRVLVSSSCCIIVLYFLLSILSCIGLCFFVALLPLVVPLLIMLSIVILKPVEKIISDKYINKAKAILCKYSNLIKIGITGSYGKTSTKEILNNILSTQYYTLATPKSFNTPFGITKTIINNLLPVHQVLICELGAKKSGEISELCGLVDVEFGIVTAVGRQHMNTFKSLHNVYKTKNELPEYLTGKSCVFNLMNEFVSKMYDDFMGDKIGVFIISKHNIVKCKKKIFDHKIVFKACYLSGFFFYKKLFEMCKFNNIYAKNVFSNEDGLEFEVYYGYDYICKAKTHLIGEHNVINILLAVAMAKLLNVTNKNIELGISRTIRINARFEKFVTNKNAIVINNGYNSNLDSAKYSFESLSKIDRINKVVITPGLIDCKNNYQYNFEFGKLLSLYATEVVIVKEVNRKAILDGLLSGGFDRNKIGFEKNFNFAQKYINDADGEYVFLIENDLPDNFK